jgi:hypothetical protein
MFPSHLLKDNAIKSLTGVPFVVSMLKKPRSRRRQGITLSGLAAMLLLCASRSLLSAAQTPDSEKPVPILTGSIGISASSPAGRI